MKTIWKYQLSVTCDRAQQIMMPKDAIVVCVHEQDEYPTIWVECDSKAPLEKRAFGVFGTGFTIPSNPMKHIGSAFCGRFVWHVYELI